MPPPPKPANPAASTEERMRLAVGLACLAAMAGAADAQTWTVGEEREVQPGEYAKLIEHVGQWSVWRLQSRDASHCQAVLPAEGAVAPTPAAIGVWTGPYPAILLGSDGDWSATGQGGRQRVEVRHVGDKFFQDFRMYDAKPTLSDGDRLEIIVSGWRYPASYVGRMTAAGTFKVETLGDVLQAVATCEAAKP